jgi:Zn-dependent peptidase ImmA (M78 family)/DNA-binding XRE family transcriptional regulator
MTDLWKSLGSRIGELRKNLQMTQGDLAKALGVSSPQIVSQIEQGKREIGAWELASLAKVFRTTTSALLDIREPETQPEILWRKVPDQEALKKMDFLKHCREYFELEQFNETNTPCEEFPKIKIDFKKATYAHINQITETISLQLSLGSKPALVLEKTLEERYGVKVWYMDLGVDGSAAATIGSFGPAILMNSSEAPWRRNYNFAHEVFHLVTWENSNPEILKADKELFKKVESFANVFASCLLLPGDAITNASNRRLSKNTISYTDLIEIAREFAVSTEALVYRLQNLRRLDKNTAVKVLQDPQFRELDRTTMPDSWWDPPELPERFVRLAFIAYKKKKITRSRLSQYLNKSLLDLNDFLLSYGLDEKEDYQGKVRIT